MSIGVFDLMQDKAQRRADNWKTEITDILPPPEWMNEATIVSIYSRTGLSSKRRYLLKPVLIPYAENINETPSAIARDYLMCKYKKSPSWTASQKIRVQSETSNHPLFCKPSTFDHGFYIDIAAAYWSIMVRCGWNVDYFPARWLGLSSTPPLDFPYADHKRARSCLVSVARSTDFNMWSPDKNFFKMTRGNPRANDQLYTLIQDALNGVASEAIAAGACYVFSDGYIAPNPKVAYKIIDIIYSWGFTPRIAGEGQGFVNALGSYTVGLKHTKKYINEPVEFYAVKKLDYHNWLRNELSKARARAPWHDNFTVNVPEPLKGMGGLY